MRKIYKLLALVPVLLLFFFLAIQPTHAAYQYNSISVDCNSHGSGLGCNNYYAWLGFDDPAYRMDWNLAAQGYGNAGPSGGRVGVWVCFSPNGAMWNGPCKHAVTPDLPNAGKSCLH